MSKRIFTTYSRLGDNVKKAIQRAYPEGVEDNLALMKNAFSGKLFEGLLFDFDDVTYMIEWNVRSSFAWEPSDDWDEESDPDPDLISEEEFED